MDAQRRSHTRPDYSTSNVRNSPFIMVLQIMQASGLLPHNLPYAGTLWVRLACGHAIQETLPVPTSTSPEWHQDFQVQVYSSDILEVTILASDGRKRWELCAARVAVYTLLQK
eukprot:EG_transcript_49621